MSLNRLLDWIIVTLGLLSTLLVTIYVSNKNRAEDEIRFQYETKMALRRIQTRMANYEGTLIQLRAFLKNSDQFRRERLENYIQDTEVFDRLPGLQGLGFTLKVDHKDLPTHIKEMRKVIPGYRVFPEFPERKTYYSIVLLQPPNRRNKKAIGFDMYSEAIRNKAMQLARDGNKAVMSGLVTLVQEDDPVKLPGFNLYLPYYRNGADTSTVLGRRKGILGFVYSPFRAEELFRTIFNEFEPLVDVEIYDEVISPKSKYYDHHPDGSNPKYLATNELHLNERTLIVRTKPMPNFPEASSIVKTLLVFSLGTLITALIYSIYLFMRKQMHLAKIVAEDKEKLLLKEKEHVAARDDFLSIASHELKTPLTSLKLQAQVMMRSISRNDPLALSKEKVTNLVNQIDTQTTRLTRLVDDMLDISRIRTGRLKIIRDSVDLNEVILDVIERIKPQFINAIGETPELELLPNISGEWDRFRIEQVLTNLFTNAIRYGQGKPIKVKTNLEGKCAVISVTDHGIGIAKENTEKIFDRFERAGMSANEVSGLGLGLFITSQIVKAHGGHIKVISELGKGSTFVVKLPIK